MAAATGPPQLVRSLTQTLAESLVDAPPSREPTGNNTDQGSEEPLQPHNSDAHVNGQQHRDAYQENQRRLAAEVLQGRTAGFACFLILLGLALFIFTCVIYCRGYRIYFDYSNKPCDEPLSAWLLVVILAFPVRISLMIVYRCLRGHTPREETNTPLTKCIHTILHTWHLLGNPLLLFIGFYWLAKTKTCHDTNPDLYDFARLFFVYQVIMWVGGIVVFCGATSLILWLMAQGAFDDVPGRARAAEPGTTERIETVPYTPDLFENEEAAQCCVCQVDYTSSSNIKRTPCGHLFHEECLRDWLEKYAKTCPICRLDLEEAVNQGGRSGP